MKLVLPGPHDPLTVREQADLERQIEKGALETHLALLTCEYQNVLRLMATLDLYRRLLGVRGVNPDEALPARVRVNGIDYLEKPTHADPSSAGAERDA